MNLHGIAAGIVGAVNPPKSVTVWQSSGYTIGGDGTQTPSYTALPATTGQVQPLSSKDIEHLSGLNIQGVQYKVYLSGNYEGLFRVSGKGGDLLKFDSQTWLVAAVLERWPDWCCLAVTLQTDGA